MESPRPENKAYLFPIVLLLFVFALFFRLVKAESIPFTRVDADLAWQAFEISKLQPGNTSPLALYTGLTGLLFWLSSSSNIFARLIPALFGSLLVFVPFALLNRTKPIGLLGLSLQIALDPILVIYSRQLNGPILAISTLIWTLVLLYKRKPIAAGIAFGMAILAGKYFWIAITLLGVYFLLNYYLNRTRFEANLNQIEKLTIPFFTTALASSVLISSSFFLNPAGLSGIASGLVDLFAVNASGSLPIFLPLFLLLTYSLYLLLPFLKAIKNSSSQSWQVLLGILGTLILITALFQNQYPGLYALIQVFLIFCIAKNITSFQINKSELGLVSLVSFVFFVVILTFTLISFQSLGQSILGEFNLITDLLPILLALALISISYLLIGLGWGFAHCKPALQAAIMLIALLFSLGFSVSQTWNTATVSQLLFTNSEILFPDSPLKNELTVFTKNKAISPSMDSYKIENSLSKGENWEFRDFYDSVKTASLPAFVINDSVTESGLMAAYRGTAIVSARRLNFSDKANAELIYMISSKTLPVSDITRTLWVQTLLFPGGK